MQTYILKRLLLIIPTLLGAATLVFLIMRVIPGDGSHRSGAGKPPCARDRNRFGFFQPLKKNLNLGVNPGPGMSEGVATLIT